MAVQMLRPTRHPKTGTYRLRLAVPHELREVCFRLYGVRHELIGNLGTRDHREAKVNARQVEQTLRNKLEVCRKTAEGEPPVPTDRQIAALAGVVYGRELAQAMRRTGIRSSMSSTIGGRRSAL